MAYVDWIKNVERFSVLEYRRLPEYIKDKVRANYREYCESYDIAPDLFKI